MTIEHLGLVITNEKLLEVAQEILELEGSKPENYEFTLEDSKAIIEKTSISKTITPEDFLDFLNKQEVFALYGYKTSEDYDNCNFNVIAEGYGSSVEALMALKGSYYNDFFIIKLKSHSGENCHSMIFEDFIREKKPIVDKYLELIDSLHKREYEIEKELSEMIIERDPSVHYGDAIITKSDLYRLVSKDKLIFNDSLRDEILKLLERDEREMEIESYRVEDSKEKQDLDDELEAVIHTKKRMIKLVKEILDIDTLLGFYTSNMKEEEVNVLFEIENINKMYYIQPYNYKYIFFAKGDIRDEMQSLYKEKLPESKINIKSRTMVERKDILINILIQRNERENILENIL